MRMNLKAIFVLAAVVLVAMFSLAIVSGTIAAAFPTEFFTDNGGVELGGSAFENIKFVKNVMIWFMLMLVAFLMIFIKKYEWGVALAVLLSAAGSFIVYFFIHDFLLGDAWNQDLMLMGVICAITVVIAIGCFLGTLKMWQYLFVGILFAFVFVVVEWFMFGIGDIAPAVSSMFPAATAGVSDAGGSMLVHMCAAYFGLGVAIAVREKRAFAEPMYTTTHSVSFVWLAAMLLWVLWPAFVTALLPAEQVFAGMMVCYMGGIGSVVSAWAVCTAIQKKVNPLIYTYAMLAGPVAIGTPLIFIGPWGAIVVGILAGIISALSFIYLQPWLCKKLGAVDVMGVHNLHGVAGWFGALVGVLLIAMNASEAEGMGFAALANLTGAIFVFAATLILGILVGLILKLTRGKFPDEKMFSDDADFIKNEAPV
ncbi:MAG: ammonium transporter [Methanomassiliicoccaceae archaeon]|jgi:ammonium transporter Rh|nr:ammonium transporter [Methanomassiliicoccaceae archaeon]